MLAWAYTPYYKCQRCGEAKDPGPYFVGGASSSGQSLLQGGVLQRVDSKAGTAAERGTMCEEDHSGEMGLDGRICEEMLDVEHEWMAMQERRKQDGVLALLQGGLHEIDEEEPFRVGPLELEGTAHSCSIAMECLGTREMGEGGGNAESREASWEDEGVSSFYTIKQARTRGMEDWSGSHLVREGFVGRGEEGPEIGDERRIKKGIMP